MRMISLLIKMILNKKGQISGEMKKLAIAIVVLLLLTFLVYHFIPSLNSAQSTSSNILVSLTEPGGGSLG